MKYLVTGAAGQLGQDLAQLLSARRPRHPEARSEGWDHPAGISSEVAGLPAGEAGRTPPRWRRRGEEDANSQLTLTDLHANAMEGICALDITDETAVKRMVEQERPDVIFHCAAWTNVDGAEDNVDACTAVNVTGTRNVAQAAEAVGAKLVAISTDYVFDGEKSDGYTEDDEPNPLGVYGQTKRDGEHEAQTHCSRTFVVRSAWLYGPKQERIEVKNFPKTMKRLAKERLPAGEAGKELTIVNDQIGSPTFTYDLAEALIKLAATDDYGIWHIVNSGTASWYDFAREILKEEIEKDLVVRPIPSSDYPTKATRPKYSILNTDKFSAKFGPFRTWQEALADYQNH